MRQYIRGRPGYISKLTSRGRWRAVRIRVLPFLEQGLGLFDELLQVMSADSLYILSTSSA
jgi:hypothetical protein